MGSAQADYDAAIADAADRFAMSLMRLKQRSRSAFSNESGKSTGAALPSMHFKPARVTCFLSASRLVVPG